MSTALHSQAPIICIGDALIDLLQTESVSPDHNEAAPLIPNVGGAPANVAAGIAKLGGKASFAGAVGNDNFGNLIINSLSKLGVDTTLITISNSAPTTLALVTLAPESGERSFAFYHRETAYVEYSEEDFSRQYNGEIGGLHFVSNSLTSPELIKAVQAAAQLCQQRSGLCSFDINYRSGFWTSETHAISAITQQLSVADIVKFSDEELAWITQEKTEQNYIDALFATNKRLQLIMVTLGSEGVKLITRHQSITVAGISVTAVDTTGAGDAFMAGLRFWLQRAGLNQANWEDFLASPDLLTQAAQFACACGGLTVTAYGAIPALPTLEAVNNILPDRAP